MDRRENEITMLSRVAEKTFWMGRYLERAESTARVLNSFSQLRMDLPKGSELPWASLLSVFGFQPKHGRAPRSDKEHAVVEFAISRATNPSSIRRCISAARENARTTREVMPSEIWEGINDLHLYVDETAEFSINRRDRFNFLQETILRCQTLSGFMMTVQSRDHVYKFKVFGHLLERIDFTARVISVITEAITDRQKSNPALDSLIWAGFLNSLSALTAYRRSVSAIVEPDTAVNLLVLHKESPRSVAYCLQTVEATLSTLEKSKLVLDPFLRRGNLLQKFDATKLTMNDLKKTMRDLKRDSEAVSCLAEKHWFEPRG